MYNTPPAHTVVLTEVAALRRELESYFTIADITLDQPESGYICFRGQFLQEPTACFDELRQRFERHGFTPMFRQQEDGSTAVVAMPFVFDPPASKWVINLILLLATIAATLYTGAVYAATSLDDISLWQGLPYCLSIMTILGAHELGHYFAARYHKVSVTLPYFIPFAFPNLFTLGTLGAFIRLKEPVKNRRALLDVGIAGPLAGLVFAIPILIYGLMTSEVASLDIPAGGAIMMEGNSILYASIKVAVFGQMLPGNGLDVQLNQIAWAGWVGLLVTGLNLIPLGQLDGGHCAYVLFGKQARHFFWPIILGLAILVAVSQTYTWVLWILFLFLFGRTYAEPLDDVTPLDKKRRLAGLVRITDVLPGLYARSLAHHLRIDP